MLKFDMNLFSCSISIDQRLTSCFEKLRNILNDYFIGSKVASIFSLCRVVSCRVRTQDCFAVERIPWNRFLFLLSSGSSGVCVTVECVCACKKSFSHSESTRKLGEKGIIPGDKRAWFFPIRSGGLYHRNDPAREHCFWP